MLSNLEKILQSFLKEYCPKMLEISEHLPGKLIHQSFVIAVSLILILSSITKGNNNNYFMAENNNFWSSNDELKKSVAYKKNSPEITKLKKELSAADEVSQYYGKEIARENLSETALKLIGNGYNEKSIKEYTSFKKDAFNLMLRKREPQSFYDYIVLLNPSYDKKIAVNPPIDGPSDARYYIWAGNILNKEGDAYIAKQTLFNSSVGNAGSTLQETLIFNAYVNELNGQNYTSEMIFSFGNIRKIFGEIRQGKTVIVIGIYNQNLMRRVNVDGTVSEFPHLTDVIILGESNNKKRDVGNVPQAILEELTRKTMMLE